MFQSPGPYLCWTISSKMVRTQARFRTAAADERAVAVGRHDPPASADLLHAKEFAGGGATSMNPPYLSTSPATARVSSLFYRRGPGCLAMRQVPGCRSRKSLLRAGATTMWQNFWAAAQDPRFLPEVIGVAGQVKPQLGNSKTRGIASFGPIPPFRRLIMQWNFLRKSAPRKGSHKKTRTLRLESVEQRQMLCGISPTGTFADPPAAMTTEVASQSSEVNVDFAGTWQPRRERG